MALMSLSETGALVRYRLRHRLEGWRFRWRRWRYESIPRRLDLLDSGPDPIERPLMVWILAFVVVVLACHAVMEWAGR